ncbi:MAG: hypothetical protein ABH844_01430 [Candidatus Omnitrophota bacterium]
MLKCLINTLLIVATAIFFSGCESSYPKEKLPESVKEVCKTEYKMDVDVTVAGSTMGIYYPMKGLLDAGLGISGGAWDTISNLLLIASRVVLSTDADIRFYCIITQDARLPELQVVIVKYVEDVKRGLYQSISRSESFKRTLFSINLTPQAEKERSVEKVFDKLDVKETTRQEVMDEFFRSPPTRLSDIGYWRGNFYLKDITLEEFLAAQIANRVKIDFRNDENLAELFNYKSTEIIFDRKEGLRSFLIKFKVADQATAGENGANPREKKVKELLRIINEVVNGYEFKDFDFVMMDDQLENVQLKVSSQDVYDFNRKKLSVREIVQAPAGYF